jgi:RHS repeat-associated protein
VLLEETYNASTSVMTVTEAYGYAADGLRSRYEAASSLAYDYLYDPQGNVVQRQTYQNAENGEPAVTQAIYDAYGALRSNVLISTDATKGADEVGFGGQYGYYTDPETGLVLCTHRYYDPGTGRWLTRDPISYKGGMNLYSYAGGNPINEIDPEGTNGLGDWLENLFDVKHPHMSDVHNLQMRSAMAALDNDGNKAVAAAQTKAYWNKELKRRQGNQHKLDMALTVATLPIGGGEARGAEAILKVTTSSSWRSPRGLIYGLSLRQGNRLLHIFEHLAENPNKLNHTVFNVDTSGDLINLLDEAWAKRGAHVPGDPGAYIINMGRVVGTRGEQSIRIAVQAGTSKILSAYPVP